MEYKGFRIEGDKTFGYLKIKPLGKGSVPLSLRGDYTTIKIAQQAIDRYSEAKESEPKRTSRSQ